MLALGLGSTPLSHGLASHSINAWHGAFALVVSNILFHMPQFLLNDPQTLLDELIGSYANLVAVLDPVLIIYINNGVEDVVGTWYADILTADVDDVVGIRLYSSRNQSAISAGNS